jgi:hypothetical protein
MRELTTDQLSDKENTLRNLLVDKSGRYKETPKNLLHILQIELETLNGQLNEVRAERERRELFTEY